MSQDRIYNINILSERLLPTPAEIKVRVPISSVAEKNVFQSRQIVENILDRKDPRLFLVVGPCSIHDLSGAREYAKRLKALSDKVQESLYIVMRVYFEKPRTTTGWKGFINDPDLDDSFHIDKGLVEARKLLQEFAELGLPAGTEAVDPVSPQYVHDLITWTAIGARTTESQTHRELASGLSTPVGFKNGTDGNVDIAINALKSVSAGHNFLGINASGQVSIMQTRGNRYGHLVLRGGTQPNYDSVSVALTEEKLRHAKLPVNLVVDCSHGNSHKNPALQPLVFENCVNQILEGNKSIVGIMLESNLHAGRQDIPKDHAKLQYGVSITDACIDWESTEKIILSAAEKLKTVLATR